MTLPGGEALAAGSHAIRQVAGNAGIRRIEIAWAVGIAADWAYLVALLIAAYAAGGAFGVATGLAILRGAALPTWMGWVTFLIAFAMLTPGVLIGLVLLILWSAVASILIYRRTKPVVAEA